MWASSGPTVKRARDVAGTERAPAGAELDGLVADLDHHGTLEDIEALVVAVVDVERGREAGEGR